MCIADCLGRVWGNGGAIMAGGTSTPNTFNEHLCIQRCLDQEDCLGLNWHEDSRQCSLVTIRGTITTGHTEWVFEQVEYKMCPNG